MSKHSELAEEIEIGIEELQHKRLEGGLLLMGLKLKEARLALIDQKLSGVREAIERCFVIRDTSPLVKIHESLKVD